jgi:hypothetical protein
VQFVLLSATLAHFAVGMPAALSALEPLWWITATTTISSGLMYLDGSGRSTITRGVKDKVVDGVTARVKVVEHKMKEIISKNLPR